MSASSGINGVSLARISQSSTVIYIFIAFFETDIRHLMKVYKKLFDDFFLRRKARNK